MAAVDPLLLERTMWSLLVRPTKLASEVKWFGPNAVRSILWLFLYTALRRCATLVSSQSSAPIICWWLLEYLNTEKAAHRNSSHSSVALDLILKSSESVHVRAENCTDLVAGRHSTTPNSRALICLVSESHAIPGQVCSGDGWRWPQFIMLPNRRFRFSVSSRNRPRWMTWQVEVENEILSSWWPTRSQPARVIPGKPRRVKVNYIIALIFLPFFKAILICTDYVADRYSTTDQSL